MSSLLYSLGRMAFRSRWKVLGAWILILAARRRRSRSLQQGTRQRDLDPRHRVAGGPRHPRHHLSAGQRGRRPDHRCRSIRQHRQRSGGDRRRSTTPSRPSTTSTRSPRPSRRSPSTSPTRSAPTARPRLISMQLDGAASEITPATLERAGNRDEGPGGRAPARVADLARRPAVQPGMPALSLIELDRRRCRAHRAHPHLRLVRGRRDAAGHRSSRRGRSRSRSSSWRRHSGRSPRPPRCCRSCSGSRSASTTPCSSSRGIRTS